MQSDKTCSIVEQYLAYLVTIKGRSKNTILEYRLDLLQFFRFIARCKNVECPDFQFANIEFIQSIQLGDMYAFLAYCQNPPVLGQLSWEGKHDTLKQKEK